MFTGIIEETGTIHSMTLHGNGAKLHIGASHILSDTKIGDSISVNGCCLTVIKIDATSLHFDIVEETMLRTSFKHLKLDTKVNLERAVKMQDRLSGHLVQGHVDNIGRIESIHTLTDASSWVTISAPHSILRYLIPKGSITIEGVSLTIAEVTDHTFSFAMIPHTTQVTTLGSKTTHDFVNIEIDMMAKYIERLMTPQKR